MDGTGPSQRPTEKYKVGDETRIHAVTKVVGRIRILRVGIEEHRT